MGFRNMLLTAMAALLASSITSIAVESLELAAPFQDGAILQRDTKLPVWGWSAPGDTVTVEFLPRSGGSQVAQKKTSKASDDGEWMVWLDPLRASFVPARLVVHSTIINHHSSITNILVGEVWHASGQSNMEWVAGKSMCADLAKKILNAQNELPIREFRTDTVSALYPQKRATAAGGWKSSKEAMQFSALALSFAHSLYAELHVPIGILLTSHSNTRVEAFASRESFENHPALGGDVELIENGDPLTERGRLAFEQFYKDLRQWESDAIATSEAGGKWATRPNLPGIAGMWRGPTQFFNGKINPVVPYAIRGSIWCQGTSNSSDGEIYAARMEALVKGWRDAWKMPKMPFYFTQMQAYGTAPDPNQVGFADIRQAQFKYFLENRDHVGMVVQTDLNSARPGGIHYQNKLHPGMRLARWALANEYGRDIAFTGPIYKDYRVDGNKVIVSFEESSLYGGLMVGSKGMAKDYRQPDAFVEPARPTPDAALNHFRLCGKDRKWHPAEAVIVGDTVMVMSKAVPQPIGVQYAYSAVPMESNLYNKPGLPATPFAAIDGKLIFQADEQAIARARAPKIEASQNEERPMLHIANYLRDGVVLQRNQPIPLWGHANAGAEVRVRLGDAVQTTTANALEQWSVKMPAMSATATPLQLSVTTSLGASDTVRDILIGDVWYLTGGDYEMAYDPRHQDVVPEPLPLVREFKRNTKASTDVMPRKRRFETGGGKYRSHWLPADYTVNSKGVTMFAYWFAKTLDRQGIPQGFVTMSSGHNKMMASPLSWTPYRAVKELKDAAFKACIAELKLQYPDSDVAREALNQYILDVKKNVYTIQEIAIDGGDLSTAPRRFPQFPVPGSDPSVPQDAIPTYTYNWCVSPLTPMAVAGVIWVPAKHSIGHDPANYARELEIYARSLPATYGQEHVPFMYAQPSAKVVAGITEPSMSGAVAIMFDSWPKNAKALAQQMAASLMGE